MNYIFYQTKTKYTNAGDVLINKALITKLRNFGVIKANCSESIPDIFLEKLGITQEERLVSRNEIDFSFAIIKFALKHNKDNIYIFSGLGDSYGGGIKRVFRNLMSGSVYMIYKLLGIKTVRIGRSVGTYTKAMAISERFKALFTDFNYLRDTKSIEKCRNMKIKGAQFCPDMSWLYEYSERRSLNSCNKIAFFMRAAVTGKYDDTVAGVVQKRCEEIMVTLSKCIGNDLKIIFAYQVIEDQTLAKKLYDKFKDKYNCEYIDKQLELSEAESVYGNTDIHISNRLHSLLLGYKYGSLPIALLDVNSHYKISATYEDSGLDDMMFDYNEEINSNRLAHIVYNREDYFEKIIEIERKNANQIEEILRTKVFG